MNYRYKIGLVMGVLFFGLSSIAIAKTEYTKVYEEDFSLVTGKVDIENMHGLVNVDVWDKDRVSFKVTVIVDASSQSKANDVFDRIHIAFDNSRTMASAKTSIDSDKSNWWFIKNLFDSNDDLEVNYEVKIPRHVNLELNHRYGDANIGNVGGDLDLELKYGKFVVDGVEGDLSIHASYGNGVIANAGRSDINVAYFKLQVGKVNDLDLDSKYSRVTVEEADDVISESGYDQLNFGTISSLDNEGKYDKINVEKANDVNIYTKYTKTSIEHLLSSLTCNLSYGGLDVDHLDNGFKKIEIESRYTGISVDTEGTPGYQLRVDTRYTTVDLPSDLELRRDISENNSRIAEGYRGSSDAGAFISLDASYGKFKLQ